MKSVSEIRQLKSELRKQMKTILAGISVEEEQRQSDKVLQKLLKNEIYKNAKNVSIFLSMGTEIKTEPIIADLFRRSCKIFIPRFRKGAIHMEMVKLHSMDDFRNLPEYLWGIRQPPLEENRETVFDAGLDLVLVPGVAFTVSGKRLGHGKGFYDRFLTKCFEFWPNKRVQTIALAFREQVLPEIPTSDHDVIIDSVIFPDA